ncbi:thioester-forming surface-anchored protein, partial [Peptostreptococcus sp. D1]|uniref:thioester-forming surface-anchored protein n=1 Tax=Peptostreptococcus sp. D1 TaxID=72304 RepID=UPI0008F0704D
MNKLNKFLSIFISILTVCSGLLPSAPVFAQDSSTSNEYIYRGWKEYQNSYDQAFYVGLKDKVISEREIEDRHVAYCFNYGKPAPLDLKNPEEILYKKVNLNENNMYLYINNPESQKENYKEFYKNIMKVIYNGYPENAAGIKEDLNDGDFREATQWAVWFYTDKYNPEQDQKLIALLPLMSEGARAIWDKKIAAYKKLIGGGIVDTGNFSLDMYETNMKSSDGKKYQNLIALKKNDPKKRPEDETQYKTQVSFAKITDEEYEKLKKEKPDIYSIKGLSGVKLKIEEVDGKEICKFESKSNAGYSHELTSGKEYKLIELEAPEGYKKAEPVSFRIEEEIEMLYGFPQLKFKIYIKGANGQWEEAADNAVVMVDEKQQTTPVEPQTPEPDKTSLKVEKEWQGIDPNDAPEVTVYLVKNKEKTKESIKLNKDNKWKGEFKDLEVVDDINDNKANVYTIVEDGEEDGKVTLADTEYEVTYAGGKVINTKIVPQMSLEPAKKSLKVEKEWQGINPNDAPEVTVYLVKNDKKTDKAIKLNKDNKWKGEFEELEAVDNINDNKANVYTIVEAGEEKGKVMLADTEYKVTYAGGKVINTKVVSKTKVSFSKKALTENGEELAGAKIKLTKKDDTTEEGTTVIKEWVTDGKLTEFELEAGSYTFTEISAPDK